MSQSKSWVAPFLTPLFLLIALFLVGQQFGVFDPKNPFADIEYELVPYDDSFVMDAENGRYYTEIKVDEQYKIGVFDAESLSLIDILEKSGSFNVDQERGWLYIDDPDSGLIVFDSASREYLKTIGFPTPEYYAIQPQPDPKSGNLMLFRENMILIVDPEREEILDTISFEVIAPSHLETAMNKDRLNSISGSIYDPDNQLIYLFFGVYASGAGYLYDIMLSYDLETKQEIERYGDKEGQPLPPSGGVAYQGYLYLSESFKVGTGGENFHVLWHDGKRQDVVWDKLSRMNPRDFVIDTDRELIYQSAESNIKVWSLQDFQLQWIQPFPSEWNVKYLLGYDPIRQALVFNRNGRLDTIDTDLIKPPVAQNPIQIEKPQVPVQFLTVSPNWPDDPTIMAIWNDGYPTIGYPAPKEGCNLVEHSGWGQILISRNGGRDWRQPIGGLQAHCMLANDIGVYEGDGSVIWQAEITGKGWYESQDNGRLWQPYNIMGDENYRIQNRISLRSGAGLSFSNQWRINKDDLLLQKVKSLPVGIDVDRVVLRDINSIIFLRSENVLYRTEDNGETWTEVLISEKYLDYFVYQDKMIFLQTGLGWNDRDPNDPNAIYRSVDAGKTWEQLHFPGCIVVTAVAISPQFDQDHTLFVGTIDGQVLKFNGLTLESIP